MKNHMKGRQGLSTRLMAISPAMSLIVLVLSIVPLGVAAQPGPPGNAAANADNADGSQDGTTISLIALIERVGEQMDREFIVDARARAMRVADTHEDADYETLLALLRVNGLIAVATGDDQIMVVSETAMRSMPSRVVQDDDARVSDHEIVTRVIAVPPIDMPAEEGDGPVMANAAAMLVPVLRPIVGQHAQFSATNTNHLVIVDYYDNVRRLTEVIEEITK